MIKEILWHFTFSMPSHPIIDELKLYLLKRKGYAPKSAKNYLIGPNFFIKGKVILGDQLSINRNVMIAASCGVPIEIGNYVLIGPNVVIRNANHGYEDLQIPMRKQPKKAEPILIEDDVWIGANSVILPGAIIRKGCIVAAGAVVRRGEYPAYSIIGGVPAKIIGSRKKKLISS